MIACLVAGSFAVHFIVNMCYDWVTSPVILTLSPQTTDLKDIPFPAVTICNINKVRKSVALDILNRSTIWSASIERKLLNDYCHRPQDPRDVSINENEIPWATVQEFLFKVSQNCSKMMVACFWRGEKFNCNKLFAPSLTDDGFCCAFNVVKKEYLFNNAGWTGLNHTVPFDSVDWTMEKGYPEGTPPYTLPWRPWGPGSHTGLKVVLDAELDEFFCSTEVSVGFKLAVHNPKETPKMKAYASTVQPGHETRVVVEPAIWTSSREQLQNVPLDKRNCLFHNEKILAFYRTYSFRNCMLECETNNTLQSCGCVFFYMSRHESVKVCGRNESKCALKALNSMASVDDGDPYTSLEGENFTKGCGCIPGCFSLTYRKRLSTTILNDKASFIPKNIMGGKNSSYFSKNMAIVNVYFAEAHFTSIHRALLYTVTDFLANTGGLLGLFMGFSFLTAVEAFYFLTLRIWCFVVRNRQIPDGEPSMRP
ncbi:pickpocket protein 28-like [Macrosteles quadrilineatus]|uniref:pickpocket protein 28-like n=1 Tax=Macrosteles quadrilineatus TaxID=74068 RepID=UPI0023E096D8|nr:pickpocket protein 28-like [Macrosteles quadrilineatus]